MLQIDSSLVTLIQEGSITPFVLVKISTPSPIYVTDYYRDVIFDGSTYVAEGGLLGVSPPNSTTELGRDLFKISFADPDNLYRGVLSSEIGSPVSVLAGFEIMDTGQIHPANLSIYKGIVNNVSWEISDDSPVLTVSCSGQFTKLKHVINYTTSPSNQRALYPADSSMDSAYDTDDTLKCGS